VKVHGIILFLGIRLANNEYRHIHNSRKAKTIKPSQSHQYEIHKMKYNYALGGTKKWIYNQKASFQIIMTPTHSFNKGT
jgi:hypothetical protein